MCELGIGGTRIEVDKQSHSNIYTNFHLTIKGSHIFECKAYQWESMLILDVISTGEGKIHKAVPRLRN